MINTPIVPASKLEHRTISRPLVHILQVAQQQKQNVMHKLTNAIEHYKLINSARIIYYFQQHYGKHFTYKRLIVQFIKL